MADREDGEEPRHAKLPSHCTVALRSEHNYAAYERHATQDERIALTRPFILVLSAFAITFS